MVRPHVPERVPLPDAERDFDLLPQLLRARPVRLVDHEDIGDLHDPRLQRLDAVTGLGDEHEDRRIRAAAHIELRLSDADGLDDDTIEGRGVEHIADLAGRRRESAQGTTRRHRADEDTAVERDRFHPDPVAEQRAARKRARRVDGDDRHAEPLRAPRADKTLGERRLPGARRSGDPDATGVAQPGVKAREELLEARPRVLDDRNGPREGCRPPGGEIGQ